MSNIVSNLVSNLVSMSTLMFNVLNNEGLMEKLIDCHNKWLNKHTIIH